MRKILLLSITLITFSAFGQQQEEHAIKDVVINLFKAMQQGDTLTVRNYFDSTAHLHTALVNPTTGKTKLETEQIDDFVKAIASIRERSLVIEERIVKWDIKTDYPMASVWADYEFYVNGKFSHRGVDAFQLFKSANGWKIIQICDTRRK
jgi:hypothetical protein